MRRLRTLLVVALLILFAGTAPAGLGVGSVWAAQGKSRVSEGAALARADCSACHQVSPAQKPPPRVYNPDEEVGVAAPSFMKIARDPTNNADALRTLITRPHYPMREQSFDKDDLDAIVAYILSLRPRPASH